MCGSHGPKAGSLKTNPAHRESARSRGLGTGQYPVVIYFVRLQLLVRRCSSYTADLADSVITVSWLLDGDGGGNGGDEGDGGTRDNGLGGGGDVDVDVRS